MRLLAAMCALIAAVIAVPYMGYADDADEKQQGFISQAISDAVGKINEYTSGEKHIISEDAQGADISAGRDDFGRRLPPPPPREYSPRDESTL
jgi:hypothetical protein